MSHIFVYATNMYTKGFAMDDTIFQKRLKELRGERKLFDIAKDLGISRASLGYYENGDRRPDIDILVKIAKYYDVPSDWLLGLSDVKSHDLDMKAFADKTGLSEYAVKRLVAMKSYIDTDSDVMDDAYDAETPLEFRYGDKVGAKLGMFGAIEQPIVERELATINDLIEDVSLLREMAFFVYCNFDSYLISKDGYQPLSKLSIVDTFYNVLYPIDNESMANVFLSRINDTLHRFRDERKGKNNGKHT